MARLVKRTGEAREDSLEIWNYIAHGNPISGDPLSADRVLTAIEDTYQHLAEFPHKTQIAGRDLFKATVEGFKQYLIVYRFDDEAVEILRVFRADLDWTRIIAEI